MKSKSVYSVIRVRDGRLEKDYGEFNVRRTADDLARTVAEKHRKSVVYVLPKVIA